MAQIDLHEANKRLSSGGPPVASPQIAGDMTNLKKTIDQQKKTIEDYKTEIEKYHKQNQVSHFHPPLTLSTS